MEVRPMTRHLKTRVGLLATLVLGVSFLSACMYYAGQETGLVPSPDSAAVKSPPEILSCSATFSQTSRQPHYTTECGWIWTSTPCDDAMGHDCGWWDWRCWSVWQYTEVCGDIVLKLEVYDPSDDLNASRSPSLVIHPGEPLSGVACRLAAAEKQVPIKPQDIMPAAGQPNTKTISVRYGNVCGRITGTCRELGVLLPLSISFVDCGTVMYSLNTCFAELRVK
jgi:hypothetical protein